MPLWYSEDILAIKKAWIENGGQWSDQECLIIEAREKAKMEMTVTLFDAAGNIVRQDTAEVPAATEEEISAMIDLIEGGMPAHMAADVVKSQSN